MVETCAGTRGGARPGFAGAAGGAWMGTTRATLSREVDGAPGS